MRNPVHYSLLGVMNINIWTNQCATGSIILIVTGTGPDLDYLGWNRITSLKTSRNHGSFVLFIKP